MTEEEAEEEDEFDEDKEQQKQIVKSLLYAGLGFGLFTLAGMGVKKLVSVFGKSNDNSNSAPSPTDAVDVAQQAVSSGSATPPPPTTGGDLVAQGTQQLTTDGVANASMTASQGNMSSTAGGLYAPPPGMEGAQ
jgi:hypothetical protein